MIHKVSYFYMVNGRPHNAFLDWTQMLVSISTGCSGCNAIAATTGDPKAKGEAMRRIIGAMRVPWWVKRIALDRFDT